MEKLAVFKFMCKLYLIYQSHSHYPKQGNTHTTSNYKAFPFLSKIMHKRQIKTQKKYEKHLTMLNMTLTTYLYNVKIY